MQLWNTVNQDKRLQPLNRTEKSKEKNQTRPRNEEKDYVQQKLDALQEGAACRSASQVESSRALSPVPMKMHPGL